MVSVLLAELGDVREPMTLVIDDLHHISSPEVAEQLAFFLERAPEWLRVVLISRDSLAADRSVASAGSTHRGPTG